MAAVLLSGVIVGLVYGLLAVGLVLTYQVSRIINFAYGEVGMLAAFVYLDLRLGKNASALVQDDGLLLAVPTALLIGAALGALMELLIARPLRNDPTLRGMVATIAVSLLIISFAVERYDGSSVRQTKPLIEGEGVSLLGLVVSPSQLLIVVVSAAVLALLTAVYRFTSIGLRLRATAMDPYAASLSGVNINSTAMTVWAIAGALSALSAVLLTPLFATTVLFMTLLALRSFAAALLGGLTSMVGAVLGGIALGVLESIISYTSPIGGITDAAIAVLIIALVFLRPGGLVRAAY